MQRIATSDLVADMLLEDVYRHWPGTGVDFGKPLLILLGSLVVELDGDIGLLCADRWGLRCVVARPDGRVEVTGWVHGAQAYQRSVSTLPGQPGE